MRSRPSRRRASTVSVGRRSAATGNSAIARSHSARNDDALGRMSGDRPCGAGSVSDRGASVYASPPQAPCEVLQERLFAAEQMGRARNLDPNTIRPVRRDKRAVAHAPGREPDEPFVIGLGGSFGHVKLGHERLRMSDRETKPKAERLCRLIRRYNDPARTDLRRHDDGLSRGGASPVFFR